MPWNAAITGEDSRRVVTGEIQVRGEALQRVEAMVLVQADPVEEGVATLQQRRAEAVAEVTRREIAT